MSTISQSSIEIKFFPIIKRVHGPFKYSLSVEILVNLDHEVYSKEGER